MQIWGPGCTSGRPDHRNGLLVVIRGVIRMEIQDFPGQVSGGARMYLGTGGQGQGQAHTLLRSPHSPLAAALPCAARYECRAVL